MTNRILLFGLFLLLTNCRTVQKTSYQDKGLNFKITDDFRIVENKTWKHNNATYIKIERTNKDLYANFSVTWLPQNCDLDKELQNFVDGLKEVYKDDKENTPVFSEIKSTKFGSNSAIQIDYIVANDGPRIGSYTTFHCDSLTVIIGQHFTPESQMITKECRQTIETTFNCAKPTDKK